MKNIILLFIGLVLVSCSREAKVVDLSFYHERKFKTISPKSIKSYSELMTTIQSIVCDKLEPKIIISLEKDELLNENSNADRLIIQPFMPCFEDGIPEIRTGFSIRNDSSKLSFRQADWQDDSLSFKLENYFLENKRGLIDFHLNMNTSIKDFAKITKKIAVVFTQISKNHKDLKLNFVPHLMFRSPPSPSF